MGCFSSKNINEHTLKKFSTLQTSGEDVSSPLETSVEDVCGKTTSSSLRTSEKRRSRHQSRSSPLKTSGEVQSFPPETSEEDCHTSERRRNLFHSRTTSPAACLTPVMKLGENSTRNEWRRCENYTRNEWRR